MARDLKIKPGPGGWVEATWQDVTGRGLAWALFKPDKAGTLELLEIRIPNPTADLLRRIPVGRIKTSVQAHIGLKLPLAVKMNDPAPSDLSSAEFYGPGIEEPRRYKLKRPASRRLEDDFFKNVAKAYRQAVLLGHNPRKTLAEDADAPVDSVARWIRQARELGYLPPGQPGRVTAGESD
jgi:hypothetical protein